jgi:hypothetical protein
MLANRAASAPSRREGISSHENSTLGVNCVGETLRDLQPTSVWTRQGISQPANKFTDG